MISYRLHMYRLTMRVSAEATALALSMADCVTHSHSVDYKERVRDSLPDLLKGAASLREAIDELIAALPMVRAWERLAPKLPSLRCRRAFPPLQR